MLASIPLNYCAFLFLMCVALIRKYHSKILELRDISKPDIFAMFMLRFCLQSSDRSTYDVLISGRTSRLTSLS
jgi:hypothetical protein